MIPLRLQIENFMSHRSSDIDFTGFTSALIVAKNKKNEHESNGVGKTTIFSAIEYCLFGEVPTNVLEKIIRDGQNKCSVKFEFLIGDKRYLVERGRSRSGRSELALREWVSENNSEKWVKISGTRTAEAEKKIIEIIKINHKAFSHSIKFGQLDLSGLASAKNSDERRKILQEPLNLLAYLKLHKIGVEKNRAIKREIDKVDASIQFLGDPTIDLQSAESDLKFCCSLISSKEYRINSLQTSIVEKTKALEEFKKLLDSDDSEIHSKIDRLVKRYKELKDQIAAANERVQQNTSAIDTNTKRCSQLKAQLQEIQKKEKEFSQKIIRKSEDVMADLNKVSNDELHGTKLLARYEAEYDQANKSVPDGNICTQCFQPITDEHRKQCEADTAKILAEKSEQIKNIKTNLAKCIRKKNKLQQEYSDAKASEREALDLKSSTERIESELGLLTKHIDEAEQRLASATKEMELASSEQIVVTQNLNSLKETAKNSSVADLNKKIFAITDEIRVFERSLAEERAELSNTKQRQGAATQKQNTAKENIAKLEAIKQKQSELRSLQKIHEYVVEAFGSGIPTFIIHSMLDELQIEANQCLQKLRPEIELGFSQDLEMSFRVHGRERDYDQLSIGQKVYVALSLKCGLSRVIQKKLGIDIRFMMWDEVDASLDKAGVETMVDVIRKLQNEFKILIITHNDSLKDKFSHAILVEGDGENGATSSVVTGW